MPKAAVNVEALEKSKGHLCWWITEDGVWEYFVRGADIYRAPHYAPVMPDGYRTGRWEYPDRPQFREYLRATLPRWGQVIGDF